MPKKLGTQSIGMRICCMAHEDVFCIAAREGSREGERGSCG